MKSLPLLLLAVFATASAGLKQDPDKQPITKDVVRRAIEVFRREPVSDLGRSASAIIARFADESPDVEIVFGTRTAPWITAAEKYRAPLMAAYISGSILSQLKSGVVKDDPMAATEQVIETYRQLQAAEPGLRIDEVETLIDLKKSGKLKDYLETK